jgi:hypothetical protein
MHHIQGRALAFYAVADIYGAHIWYFYLAFVVVVDCITFVTKGKI